MTFEQGIMLWALIVLAGGLLAGFAFGPWNGDFAGPFWGVVGGLVAWSLGAGAVVGAVWGLVQIWNALG